MRIGIDCRLYSSGYTGIGRYVYELARRLISTDTKNTYVLFFNEPEFSTFEVTGENVEKVRVNAGHYGFAEQTRFLRLLNNASLDLMHFTHFNAPLLYLKPYVVTIHDLTLHMFSGKKMNSFLHKSIYKMLVSAVCRRAEKIIAVSYNTKRDIIDLIGMAPEKIQVIYEGVSDDFRVIHDESSLNDVRKKFHIVKPLLLYTGNWRSHKNLTRLVQAFSLLRKRFDCQLMITGKRNELYAPEIETAIFESGVKNDVLFAGFVSEDELVALMNAAHVYVFPSLYEGFGLPPLEAMKCGTVACVSATSCLPEICGEAAHYFNPKSVEDMATELYRVCTDTVLREKLLITGQKHVTQYSWERMTEEILKLYSSVQ